MCWIPYTSEESDFYGVPADAGALVLLAALDRFSRVAAETDGRTIVLNAWRVLRRTFSAASNDGLPPS